MSFLDHATLPVSNYSRSKAFYELALAPLGATVVMDFGTICGFGREGKPELWIGSGPASFQTPKQLELVTPTHLAFAARNRAEVDAFHQEAIKAGGKDFGAPGVRPHYHANYYAAFVLDPDGHNVEAVFHGNP